MAGASAGMAGLADVDVSELMSDLAGAGITVAAAESLTGGLLMALLTEVPGASEVLRGGLVVYATELKHTLAGVPADLLAARGPVDPDVAVELARGVRAACGASVGLGLTGVAGPDPQNGIAVGVWCVALDGPSGVRLLSAVPGDDPGCTSRAEIRNAAVRAAVELLTELVP